MTIQTRPDNQVFASGANPGEVALFPDILRGWGVTLGQTEGKPPMEWMNGVMQRFDQGIQYALQRGIPEWHSETDYPAHAVVQHDGLFYVSVKDNTGSTPGTDAEKWGVFWDGIARLKMYKTLPLTNEGDIHLLGLGAHTWSSQQNRYIPINQPAKRVGMLETFFSRQHLQKEGGTPRDGQLVPRALFPDFVREYLDNGVLPCALNDAAWLADTSLRTQWVANDGKGNFRVPDWNGKQPGSVAVYGGRGDGTKSNGVHGKIQFDQQQGHRHAAFANNTKGYTSGTAFNDYLANTGTNNVQIGVNDPISDGVNGTPRVGDETRVTAPTVVWGVYLSNATETTLSPAEVDALVGQYSALNSEVQTQKARLSNISQITLYPNGGSETVPANITYNAAYVMDSPFGKDYVEVKALVFFDGRWGEAGWIFDHNGGWGINAGWRSDGKIVVQTGGFSLGAQSNQSGNSFQSTSHLPSTMQCKVIVRRIQ